MLKKIIILISFIFISFTIYADSKDDIINQLVSQLEKSTALIQEQNNTIKNNNKTIQDLKQRIIDDQKEIKELRDKLETSTMTNTKTYYSLTGIINYGFPDYRLDIIFGMKLPIIPITVNTAFGITNEFDFSVGLGATLEF